MTKRKEDRGKGGRVVETRGRRVRVVDSDGDRVCFLSGQRAVVGDQVRWVEAQGTGGKVIAVQPRDTELCRVDVAGRHQVLAANLHGVLVVAAAKEPPFRAGLLDRYLVAARSAGLDVAVCINKIDRGVSQDVRAEIELRQRLGVPFFETSVSAQKGLSAIEGFFAERGGAWALVGHSGVGKTSLIGALLPEVDVGAVGELSDYWGTGQHTTTASRLFGLPQGGEIVDSPGIRTFTPGGITVESLRMYFPGLEQLRCKYRDCQHRPDEAGCRMEEEVPEGLWGSYRRLLEDVRRVEQKTRLKRRR